MPGRTSLTIVFVASQLLTASLPPLDRQVIEDRVKRLEGMSKTDRDQFNRSVEEFEKMSDDERSRIRALHDALMEDRKIQGPLSPLLQTYTEWLNTLTPLQRDELQREKVTSRKVALIRKLKEELDHKSKEEDDHPNAQSDGMNEETLSYIRRMIDQPYGFDINDLLATLKVLVNDLPPDKRQPGFDAPQLSQYTQIVHSHAKWKQSYREWPDQETLGKISKAIRPRTAERIKHSNAMGETPRETAVRQILMGIVKQADLSVRISNDEREKALNSFKPEERKRVEKLSVDRRNRLLRKRYFDLYEDHAYKQFLEVRKAVIELFPQMEVKLPSLLEKSEKALEKHLHGKG